MKENIEVNNKIFVVTKPLFISSNNFLYSVKRKYNTKKVGFSGTLDPFAKGSLVIATGQFTKLFRFLKKTTKTYRTTLWLGARSETLDIEDEITFSESKKHTQEEIQNLFSSMIGNITYEPPKYSAKKIAGKRAYKMARDGEDFKLADITTKIHKLKLLNYCHPFVSFEIEVSEGGYIRSIGSIIAKRLKEEGILSFLYRLNEGEFYYEDEKILNVLDYLNLEENFYLADIQNVLLGKKLNIEDFKIQINGTYYVVINNLLSIISLDSDNEKKVKYELNRIELC